jgi:hypothetical protein
MLNEKRSQMYALCDRRCVWQFRYLDLRGLPYGARICQNVPQVCDFNRFIPSAPWRADIEATYSKGTDSFTITIRPD